jgi:hypothetical protein
MTTSSINRVRYVDDSDERVHPNIRLPRHLIEELDELPGSRTEKIELAVRRFLDAFYEARTEETL